MATNIMTGQVRIEHDFSRLQKYALMRFHPRSLFIDTIGLIWFTYYFWYHDWKMAIGAAVVARVIAIISAMNIDTDLFAETTLGKIGLLHLNPLNLATQIFGVVGLLLGVWDHSVELTLIGFSIVLVGHLFGWSKVDESFVDRK